MKVMTILVRHPEIIRLSRIIEKLDSHRTQVLVHNDQNLDKMLSDDIFENLNIRKPNYFLGI